MAVSHIFARLAVSVAVGWVGANHVFKASGHDFGRDESVGIFITGVVLGCLALALLIMAERLIAKLTSILAATRGRPNTLVVVTFLVMGVACLIASALGWGGGASSSMQSSAGGGSTQVSFSLNIGVFGPVTNLAVMLCGLLLVGLGVWGSIPPTPSEPAAANP